MTKLKLNLELKLSVTLTLTTYISQGTLSPLHFTSSASHKPFIVLLEPCKMPTTKNPQINPKKQGKLGLRFSDNAKVMDEKKDRKTLTTFSSRIFTELNNL